MWRNFLPFMLWWPEVNRKTLRADALAGFTGAIVVLPQGVAFATIAGMPPEYGLYAAMVPAVVAALFGSSRLLVSGPTTAASVVLLSTLSTMAAPGSATYVYFALTLTFMVGLIQFVMGLARLGHLVNFISHSVIVGFTAGAALLIAASQTKHFLGIELPSGLHVYEVLAGTWKQAGQINWLTVLVGVVTVGSGLVARRWFKQLPYMLVAIVVGTISGLLVNRFLNGSVELVGVTPEALPPLSMPSFTFATWQQLAPAALAVTVEHGRRVLLRVRGDRFIQPQCGELRGRGTHAVGFRILCCFACRRFVGSGATAVLHAEGGYGRCAVSGRCGVDRYPADSRDCARQPQRRDGAGEHVSCNSVTGAGLRDHARCDALAGHLSASSVAAARSGPGAGSSRTATAFQHRRVIAGMPAD
jgi:hypothetical protein